MANDAASASAAATLMPPAWIALATIEFILLLFFTFSLLRHFAARSTPLYALVCVFVCWYLGFFGTLFLPIDIAEAYASRYLQLAVQPPNATAAFNVTASGTPTLTPTASFTASVSGTPSWTPSISATPSWTPSASLTPSATPSWGSSPSNTPSATLTGSPTPTSSSTRTPTSTSSSTRTPTSTSTRSGSSTRSASRVPKSNSMTPTPTSSVGFWCEGNCGRQLLFAPPPTSWGGRFLRSLYFAIFDTPTEGSAPMRTGGYVRRAQATVEALPFNGSATPSVSPAPSPASSTNSTPWWVAAPAVEVVLRNGPLESMWIAVYWLTAILTYVVVPVVQEYVAAGEFTKLGRLRAAVLINVVFYAAIGVLAFGALAYVVFVQGATLADLSPALISIANTSGLVIIILLLGYGAAEVPRVLWRRADPVGELRRLYFKAPEADGALFDTKQELGDTLAEIDKFASRLEAMSKDKDFSSGEPHMKLVALQRALEVVNRKVGYAKELLGKSYGATVTARKAANARSAAKDEMDEDEDEKGFFGGFAGMFKGKTNKYKGVSLVKLAALHKRIMQGVSNVRKVSFKWECLVLRCIELEYIVSGCVPPVPIKRKTAEGGTFYVTTRGGGMANVAAPRGGAVPPQVLSAIKRGFASSGIALPPGVDPKEVDVLSEKAGLALLQLMLWPRLCGGFFNRALWRMRIHATPLVYGTLYFFAEVLSLLLMWSEATIWLNLTGLVSPNLSVFGLLLSAAVDRNDYFSILLASSLPLAYMCLLTMYSVFKLKIFNVLDLSGNQNTDPYSLLVNASLMNRLQFSLAFNFLNVLMHSRDKSDFPDTAFLHSVGAKMTLSVLDWFLPMGVIVVYAMCRLDLTDRLLRRMGYEEKGDPVKGSREHDLAIIDGSAVVLRGRAMLGLGGDVMSEEDRARANELSRDRTKLIMARAAARRAGRNPDDMEELAMAGGGGAGEGGKGEGLEMPSYRGGGGGGGDSGPGRPSIQNMDSFASGASASSSSGSSGAMGVGSTSRGKLSLAALAARVGMGGASAPAGGGVESYGVVDHDDSDALGSTEPVASSGGWGGGGGREGGEGGGRAGRGGGGDPPKPMRAIAKPPTLAELLKGKKGHGLAAS